MEMNKNTNGTYTISLKAFKDIADISLASVKNIYPAKKEDYISAKFDNNDELTISISVRLKQGIDIVKTCNNLQDVIYDNLSLMTGVECKNINIDIQGFVTKA